MMRVLLLSLVFSLVPVSAAQGQDSDAPERQAALSFLIGEWEATARFYDAEADSWSPTPSTRMTGVPIMGGGMVELEGEIAYPGEVFNNRLDFSYDPFRQVYRVSVLDDTLHFMDIYVGSMSDGVLEIENTNTGTAIPMDDDQYMAGRVRISPLPEGQGFTLHAYLSVNSGNDWSPYMVVDFVGQP